MVGIEMAGGVPVPLYQDAVAEEMAYVLGHCGARYVIAGDQEQVDKVLEIQSDLPNFEQMIYLDPRGLRKYDHTHLHSYAGILENGRAKSGALAAELKSREDALNYDSTCVMLYTSGTTGRPKGVFSQTAILSRQRAHPQNLINWARAKMFWPIYRWHGLGISFFNGQAAWTGFCVNCPESQAPCTRTCVKLDRHIISRHPVFLKAS